MIWWNSIIKDYHSDLRCLQGSCIQITWAWAFKLQAVLQTKTAFLFSEARYKQMRTKTLTMDKNEVRFLFSIYNISKKHCISLLLEKLHFDLHVLKSHHIGRALTRETGSGTQNRTNWSAEWLPSNTASMTTIFIETKQILSLQF